MEKSSEVLLIAACFIIYAVFGFITFLLNRNKSASQIILRELEIKNDVKKELDSMSIRELVDRSNKRWADREDNNEGRKKPD